MVVGPGRVSRAHDRELGRDIAIKELISRGKLNEARFMREALITARLEHPGIVPVYEAGRWPDGTPFYAMKLVAGRSLRDLLADRKTVDERIALLHHVISMADAIAYAHGRNIIHRDTLRQWSFGGDGLQLRDEVREAPPVLFTKIFTGGWACRVDRGILSIRRAGGMPLRFELGKPIHAIDVSPDMRYVAASVPGEIVVADLRDNRIATLAIDAADLADVGFVDASSLAVVSTTGLKTVHIDGMEYTRF